VTGDAMELQLEFWMLGPAAIEDKEKERERKRSDVARPKDLPSTKTSIKAAFRSIYVVRPVQGANVFSLTYATKEKKIQSEPKLIFLLKVILLICSCLINSSDQSIFDLKYLNRKFHHFKVKF
jgi:hypothetical protein